MKSLRAAVAAAAVLAVGALTACTHVVISDPPAPPSPTAASPAVTPEPTPASSPGPVPEPSPSPSPVADPGPTRPEWLGTRELELRDDGFGVSGPTPKVLRERALPPRTWLPDPFTDEWHAAISKVPDHVIKRSTYRKGCPVHKDDLRYLKMTFWGFDDKPHTGEMIVHKDVAKDIVKVFHTLYDARYPIEEMRVFSKEESKLPRTGDMNVTSAYACRPVATTTSIWSQHSYGLAIDLNPFMNPYTKGDLIVPELSRSYLDRDRRRPGMIFNNDVVVKAFASIGWEWGGLWATPVDRHHFALNNK